MTTDSPFVIKTLLKKSWRSLDGSKWPIWAPLLVLILISAGINLLLLLILTLFGLPLLHGSFTTGYSLGYVIQAAVLEGIIIFLTAPLITGAQMVALKRMRGGPIDSHLGFKYWSLWINLGLTLIAVALGLGLLNVAFGTLISFSYDVGFWLALIFQVLALIAFVVYYAFFIFALLFVADQKKDPLDALLACYKAVKPHWFLISKVMVCIGVGLLIMFLPYYLLSLTGYPLVSLLGALISIAIAVWAIPFFHLIISGVFQKLIIASR